MDDMTRCARDVAGAGTDRLRQGAMAAGAARNPEVSWLLRLYRWVVPAPLRRGVVARVSVGARARAKQRFAMVPSAPRLLGRVRASCLVHRYPTLGTGADRAVRLVRGVPKAVLVRSAPSPLQARNSNEAAVRRALDAAGLDYFCVRGRSQSSAVVAVAAEDRAAAHRALAGACRALPGYVNAVDRTWQRRRATRPGFEPAGWRAVAEADVIRLTWYHSDPQGQLILGPKYGCDVEFWSQDGETLVAPRCNRTADRVARGGTSTRVSDSLFTGLASASNPLPDVRTRREFARPGPEDIRFPIDAVYTWVDGRDRAWLRRRADCAGQAYHEESANAARYVSRDELRYSLRSLRQNAPWVRTVYLVTDDQIPAWLDTNAPGLRVVSHKEIFSDPSVLPTFNSHAIESQIHHIEGLSEHYLYLNDDVFLGRLTSPQDFFLANGLTKFFPSSALIPPGPPDDQDVPVAAAGKNNRALIEASFGTRIAQKMKHTPHALRRSVLYEIEERFAQQHQATASSRFRGLTDLSIVSSLHHYYAFHTARAVPGHLRYAYLDLSHPGLGARLDTLLARRDRHVFCLNDTVSGEGEWDAQQTLITAFLRSYFPVPGAWELPAILPTPAAVSKCPEQDGGSPCNHGRAM
ncbi:stealth family protein [Streptomyces flavofungini]